MQLTHYYFLALWLFMILPIGSGETCSSLIPLKDVRLASRASNAIYIKHIPNKVKIPGTSFRVSNLVTASINGKYFRAAVATSGSTTMIGFRGPVLSHQVLDHLKSSTKPTATFQYRGVQVSVLPFFWNALVRLKPDTLIPGGIKSRQKYIITGHSLGGALASLFAFYMRVKYPEMWTNSQTSLITFGAPRVGDGNYAKAHDALIPIERKLRFVNRHDMVPHIPPTPSYKHHSREVMIWKKRTKGWWGMVTWKIFWQVCKRGENPTGCSGDTWHSTSSSNSMDNYQQAIMATPSGMYDENGNPQGSFKDALC